LALNEDQIGNEMLGLISEREVCSVGFGTWCGFYQEFIVRIKKREIKHAIRHTSHSLFGP
jgi:hypothetical protein